MWEDESKLGKLMIRPEYIKVAGGLVGGVLLSQIVYWFRPKQGGKISASLFREGRRWVAKTHAQWAEECGIGLYEVKAQLAKFEQQGWIIQRFWKFGNRPMYFVSLELEKLMASVKNSPPDGVVQSQSDIGSDQTSTSDGVGPLMKPEVNLGSDQTSYLEGNSLTDTALAASPPQGVEVATIQEMLSEKAKKDHGPQAFWKSLYSETYGGFQKPMSVKEQSQLKNLYKWLEGEKIKAGELVRWMFSNFNECRTYVKVQEGLATAPDKPNIGWVLQYRHHIASVWQSASATPVVVAAPTVLVVQSIAQLAASTEQPVVMSDAEIAASLDKF